MCNNPYIDNTFTERPAMKTTIAKKACKCNLCKRPIAAGDVAKWVEVVHTGHGEWSGKAYTRREWKLECLEGCGEHLYKLQQEQELAKKQHDAQIAVDSLRSAGVDIAQINAMIALFAIGGIVVK